MQGSTRIDELRQKFHENPRRYFAPLANEYRKAGDPEQAIAICRAHLAQQPGHMSGHVVYGQALFDANRKEEARSIFEKALALDPDNAIVLKHLGDISREKGENAEAKHWYSRAIDIDPGDGEVAAYIAELTEPATESAEAAIEEPARAAASDAKSQELEAEREAPVTIEREPEVTAEPEPALEAAPEPVIAPIETSAEPAPAQDEVVWRKTPPHEDSPFVTRTMAELYASQGYRQAALEVYRQLALHHPEDKEIFDRIEELERGDQREATPTQPAEAHHADSSPDQASEAHQADAAPAEPAAPEPLPFEPMISDLPVESSEMELDNTAAFAPTDEDLNLSVTSSGPEPHFTEMELGTAGDAFDSDSWGAGFSSDEDLNLDFNSPDIPAAAPEAPTREAEEQPSQQPETSAEEQESPSVQAMAETPESPSGQGTVESPEIPLIQPTADIGSAEGVEAPETPAQAEQELDAAGAVSPADVALDIEPASVQHEDAPVETEPDVPVLTEPAIVMSPPQGDVAPEPAAAFPPDPAPEEEEEPEYESASTLDHAEYEPEPEEASFVAYSPQLPEKEDLPHYAPKHPTVREFFATIGAFRPYQGGSSITAHAAMPEPADAESSDEYPLAHDAFANLFGDSPVDEEDNRAAFALSGAIGSSTPPSNVAVSAPSEPQPPAESVSPAPAQESEEDIRRFREWLDGLAES